MSREKDKKATFSWKKSDFEKNNVEVPDSLLNDEMHTEGEKLSEADIISWIQNTQKTFCIIREQDEKRFEDLYKGFLLDLEYLIKIGKISEESLDTILDPDLYHF